VHRSESSRRRTPSSNADAAKAPRVATLTTGLADGAFGTIGSPHGAEFMQGPSDSVLLFGLDEELAVFSLGRDSRGPQQHEAPLHFEAHLQ
jgi:hypothetical protein